MNNGATVLKYLKKKGCRFFSGVPCSMLKGLVEAASKDTAIQYIPAVRENAALGASSGAYLAGKTSCIMMQNSGVGNIINALTSFNLIYKVPVLMIITWRGYKGHDAPEHIIMGEKTIPLLKEIGIPCRVIGKSYKKEIDWAFDEMARRTIPVGLILKEAL